MAISEKFHTSFYQNDTEVTITFLDRRESAEEKRKIESMHFDPGLYPSIVGIVVAMNDKVSMRKGAQTFENNRTDVSVDKIT